MAARTCTTRTTAVTAWLALVAATLSGCATATLDVVSPVPVPIDAVKLVVRDDTGGDMSLEQLRELKRALTHELEDAGIAVVAPSSPATSVRLLGNVTRYDPGLRPLRFVSRYGFGTGTLDSTWLVADPRSSAASRCRIEGSVSMGTFGGSFEDVQEEAGKALARFLKGDIQ